MSATCWLISKRSLDERSDIRERVVRRCFQPSYAVHRSVFPESQPDGYLDRQVSAILPMEAEWFSRVQGRLRHEAWHRTAVLLRGMDQERMAQIGRTGFARRQGLRPLGAHAVQHRMRHAGFAGRREQPRHVEMRADPYSGRRVVLADVRKQKQHQQRVPATSR
jgi:hypothetical protein